MYFRVLAVFAIAFGALLVQSAPVENKRQSSNPQCDAARSEIVADITLLKCTVDGLATQVASDPTSAVAVCAAEAGIAQAQQAIGRIVSSIEAAQKPSPDDRVQVETGLNTVFFGLGNVTSTDPAVQANVQKALSQLQQAGAAGDSVLANCN